MSRFTLCLIVIGIVAAACDRRPVQQDVPVHDTLQQSKSAHRDLTSSPGAADAPYELQFIDTMIALDGAAIDAAQLAPTRAEHDELKQLARSIVTDRQNEMARLGELRAQWFGDKPPAINMQLAGMRRAVDRMDIEKLDGLKLRSFDLEFIDQMSAQHEGAIEMARELLAHDANAELNSLAENIVKVQTAEIQDMRDLQRQWNR